MNTANPIVNGTEWTDVYWVKENVEDLIGDHPHLQQFREQAFDGDKICYTTYYQTYGGGPEGGYFVKVASAGRSAWCEGVWAVERTWDTPFQITKLSDDLVFKYKPENVDRGRQARCRLVSKRK